MKTHVFDYIIWLQNDEGDYLYFSSIEWFYYDSIAWSIEILFQAQLGISHAH